MLFSSANCPERAGPFFRQPVMNSAGRGGVCSRITPASLHICPLKALHQPQGLLPCPMWAGTLRMVVSLKWKTWFQARRMNTTVPRGL